MGLKLITPAATYPVALASAKVWCAIEGSDRDAEVTQMITLATNVVERFIGRGLVEQVWRLTLDMFSPAIELGKGPVVSVDAVQYVDANGNVQAVDHSVWSLDLVSDPSWIVLNQGNAWPETLAAVNVVSITFTVGFDAGPDFDVIKAVIRAFINQMFDDRGAVSLSPAMIESLRPYRRLMI